MKTLKRVRKTGGRCYELAGKIMLNEPGAERFTLVHGRLDRSPSADRWPAAALTPMTTAMMENAINLPNADADAAVIGWPRVPRVHHAWIDLNDGRVFCTTWKKYAPADEYARRWGAVADRRYTQAEAVKLMLASGHFGPWDKTKRHVGSSVN
jgi:hypothetical protein